MHTTSIQLYTPVDLGILQYKFIALVLGGAFNRPKKVSYSETGFVMEFEVKDDKAATRKTKWITNRYSWWFMASRFVATTYPVRKALTKQQHKELLKALDKTELKVI